MSLRFVLCATCGRHGRFVGGPRGAYATEVASKETAYRIIDAAFQADALSGVDAGVHATVILQSALAEKEDDADPALRAHVATWNEAAAATNRPDLFALSDFHDYVRLLGTPAAPCGIPQPN